MSIVYKKNFISNVIFRIDFSPISDLEEKTKEFHNLINESFPNLEPVISEGFLIESVKNEDPRAEKIKQIVWQYTDKDRIYNCNLAESSLVIVSKKYEDFTGFKKIFSLLLNNFLKVYSFPAIIRIGLRYINEITLEDKDFFEWGGLINQKLIDSIDFVEDKKTIRRLMERIELKVDDDTSLTINSGIFNSNHPSEIIKKEFILDLDCYSRTSIPKNEEEITGQISKYNDILTTSFEKSVGPKLKEIMGII